MRSEAASQEDIAFGIEPCSPPVIRVTANATLTLQVEFADGVRGEVKFLPTHLTGVFEPLQDREFFSLARVENGVVTWPGDLDLAPDAMYDEVKSNGVWLLK
jgi:Protein of unknown function (DUF2442)